MKNSPAGQTGEFSRNRCTYKVKETKAPEGYEQLNYTLYKIMPSTVY